MAVQRLNRNPSVAMDTSSVIAFFTCTPIYFETFVIVFVVLDAVSTAGIVADGVVARTAEFVVVTLDALALFKMSTMPCVISVTPC